MTEGTTARQIISELAAARARKLRRATIALSVIYFVVVTGAFGLMVVVDPPRQYAEVTAFQDACIVAMLVGSLPGYVAVVMGVVGVVRKSSRRVMWLPLAVSVVLLFLPALAGIAWQMLILGE